MLQPFDGFKICENLKPKECCFKLYVNENRKYITEFHHHVPESRLSAEERKKVLKQLLIKYLKIHYTEIVNLNLNNRKGKPIKTMKFNYHFSYPEPGVFREYFSYEDAHAWVDVVINEEHFRK